MSKKLICLTILIVLGVTQVGLGGNIPDLAAWWELDDGAGTIAADGSGNEHHGQVFGDAAWVNGIHGGALQFDGVDDRVEMPTTSPAQGFPGMDGEVTWAMWFKTRTGGTIMAQGPAGAAHVRGNRAVNVEGVIRVRAHSVGALTSPSSNAVVDDNEWHHVAVTIAFETSGTNDTMKVYIDGDLSLGYETDTVNINSTADAANDFIVTLGARRSFYAGLIDDVAVFSRVLSAEEILAVMEGLSLSRELASNPSPANEATDVLRDSVLSWTAGQFAAKHDIYFGTVFDDVNNASVENPLGVIVEQGLTATTYDPPGLLDFGETYYWRVDEVNAPPDNTIFKGEVWSFTVEPVGYPIEHVNATASSANTPNEGSENTINGSGLDDDDLHSSESAAMWLSSAIDPNAAWIQYEFDRVYRLHQMLVWNHNTSTERVIGFGIKEATIEYSADGAAWIALGTTHEFAQASGLPGYAADTAVDLGGVAAKFIKITANSNWGGIVSQFGLSEVRFFSVPVFAREPSPDPDTTNVDVDVTLSWRAGREAATHDVYLSTDEQAVIDGTAPVVTVTEASYSSALDLASTYFWRIDEVNEAETPTTWPGDIWTFSTQEYLVVDDFESYNDLDPTDPESNRIFNAWIDGYEVATNGSLVGYENPPFTEQIIVHGGSQSMPFFYNNTGGATYSEAELTLSPAQDWTAGSAKTLSLQFYGDPNNTPGQMYVKINGSKVTYDGDASNLTLRGWQAWNIDLASAGTGLQNVTKLAIGNDGNGAVGKLLFDDIRLYPYERQFVTPVEPNNANLVAHWQFDGNALDSSANGRNGTLMGDPPPFFAAGMFGQALDTTESDGPGYVEITGYKGILGPNPFSITAWINTSDGEGTIVGWGSTAGGTTRVEFRISADRLRCDSSGN
ncbi:MAG: LamG-like jellyroll fold domain-containing protein, partial [Planctomycetota bacterium]